MKICCVVVTYNRKKLLIECINSILQQTINVTDIIVVDNNSNDGTDKFLKENNLMNKIIYKKLPENIGGAGGFNFGINESLKNQYDWVWIMDDDSIPTSTVLEELLKAQSILKDENISFLCSKVIGMNNEEMNLPIISDRNGENGYPIWMKYLDNSIVEVKAATFVSVLIKTEAIKRVGLPWQEFFIWGDDIEYTLRLNKYFGPGYAIGKSIVVHKRVNARNISLIEESNPNRIEMYKYKYRNDILLHEYNGIGRNVILTTKQILHCISILFRSDNLRYKKFKIATIGTLNGMLNIKLRKRFKDRFKNLTNYSIGE